MPNVPRIARVALAVGAAGLAGCQPEARIELYQPRIAGPQQRVELTSRWAWFATSAEGIERMYLSLPLPGAWTGLPQYLIYLRSPVGKGRCHIGDPLPDGSRVGGLLIQLRGRHHGLTPLVSGQLIKAGLPFDAGQLREVRILAVCRDGTVIHGRFVARADELEIESFEQAHAADLGACQASSVRADQSDETRHR